MKFEIDISYCTSVTITKKCNRVFENTEEGLVNALKYSGSYSTMTTEDHPEFAELREQLGRDGYIRIQRSWWNGDSVIKSFTLNGRKFRKGDQFPSGSAIKYILENK